MSHTIGQVKQDTQSNPNSDQSHQDVSQPKASLLEPISGLSDADYEFLFNQLLEGITHGWHDRRIIKFFNQLGARGQQADWVSWLERFKAKILKLPIQSKRQWGTMMIRLGELTQSVSEISQIGEAAHRLGRELLFDNSTAVIWEYAGPDWSLNQQIETEQELSRRLPADFTALGTPEIAEAELDLPADFNLELDLEPESLPQITNKSEELELKLEPQLELESSFLDDSSLELIESWFNLGLKQVSAGEYTQAIVSWDKALKINANLPEAWHNRGSALGRLGNYEGAVKSFQNALAIDPDNYQAWNDRAHALYQLENWAGAIQSWSQAIKLMPGNHLFWYNRGCALEQLAKWSDAIASYEKALEIKPDFQPGRSRYINLVADSSRPN
ncbi:MAG: tetratricopeptide repeat protein [Pleurocapsa sp. SU_5_0]|nr:tetratricopeptide repeat protein [Pleurocapsa sp. SU_5_0]